MPASLGQAARWLCRSQAGPSVWPKILFLEGPGMALRIKAQIVAQVNHSPQAPPPQPLHVACGYMIFCFNFRGIYFPPVTTGMNIILEMRKAKGKNPEEPMPRNSCRHFISDGYFLVHRGCTVKYLTYWQQGTGYSFYRSDIMLSVHGV